MDTVAVLVAASLFGALVLAGLVSRHRTAAPLIPADLMSDFEVSQAVGVQVEAPDAEDAQVQAYQAVSTGVRLLQATVLTGRAGRVAMRLRRRGGRPLARVGEEAYAGEDWVVGRHGAVVLLLQQFEADSWAAEGAMPWLLDTALGRVPQDAYR